MPKKNQRSNFKGALNPKTPKGGLLLFALMFALAGGVYFLYTSFAGTCVDATYKLGESGRCVENIQVLANHKLPYIPPNNKLTTNGQYNTQTQNGISRIQERFNISPNGVVAKSTWEALCSWGTVGPGAGGPFAENQIKAFKGAGCEKLWGKAPCTYATYSSGSSGKCVENIQVLANHKLPYIPPNNKLTTNGRYEDRTVDGITRIQQQWSLRASGAVDLETWKALCSAGTVGSGAGGPFNDNAQQAYRNAGCDLIYF